MHYACLDPTCPTEPNWSNRIWVTIFFIVYHNECCEVRTQYVSTPCVVLKMNKVGFFNWLGWDFNARRKSAGRGNNVGTVVRHFSLAFTLPWAAKEGWLISSDDGLQGSFEAAAAATAATAATAAAVSRRVFCNVQLQLLFYLLQDGGRGRFKTKNHQALC